MSLTVSFQFFYIRAHIYIPCTQPNTSTRISAIWPGMFSSSRTLKSTETESTRNQYFDYLNFTVSLLFFTLSSVLLSSTLFGRNVVFHATPSHTNIYIYSNNSPSNVCWHQHSMVAAAWETMKATHQQLHRFGLRLVWLLRIKQFFNWLGFINWEKNKYKLYIEFYWLNDYNVPFASCISAMAFDCVRVCVHIRMHLSVWVSEWVNK